MKSFNFNTKEIKHVHAYIVDDTKAIDLENHRINFVVSSEIIDRSNEVVEAQAVFDSIHRKGEFTENPICLACHMHKLENGMPPSIGQWDTETAKLRNKRVEMVLQYDTELKLGSEYWIAYKNKSMRAVSIGFRVLDYRVEERNGTRIFIATKIELIEISCVAVGCNKEALAKLKEMGIIETKERLSDVELVNLISEAVTKQFGDQLFEIQNELDEIKTLLLPVPAEDLSLPDDEEDLPGDDEKQADAGRIDVSILTKALTGLSKG